MQRFSTNLLLFIFPLFLIYCWIAWVYMPQLLNEHWGPDTETQIQQSFRNAEKRPYDMVFMGNSRIYRGLNPDSFTTKSYNFAHDNDSYNQIYYKLLFLTAQNKKIQIVLLGVDYFEYSVFSDSRNYEYSKIFNKSYLTDYGKGNYLLDHYLNALHPLHLKEGQSLLETDQDKCYQKNNGQYYKAGTGVASINDKGKYSIERLNIQVKYFKKILAHCKKRNIKILLTMLPCRPCELINYSEKDRNEFHQFISTFLSNDVVLLNYVYDKRFSMSDFSDAVHFNPIGADKFSRIASDTIEIMRQRWNK